MDSELAKKLEAVLFYKGEPMKIHALAKAVSASEETTQKALHTLVINLSSRGIRLVLEGEYAGLATAPDTDRLIEAIRKEELEGPLGKAGLETLAIIIYKGPSSRSDIEYIRGVNSSSILRSLTMRGLIEKTEHPTDKRSFLYRATPELPATLGLSSLSKSPEYETVRESITRILEHRDTVEQTIQENNEEVS